MIRGPSPDSGTNGLETHLPWQSLIFEGSQSWHSEHSKIRLENPGCLFSKRSCTYIPMNYNKISWNPIFSVCPWQFDIIVLGNSVQKTLYIYVCTHTHTYIYKYCIYTPGTFYQIPHSICPACLKECQAPPGRVSSKQIPGKIRGTPKDVGPPATHTTPIRRPWSMGWEWEAFGKGVPLLRICGEIPKISDNTHAPRLYICTLPETNSQSPWKWMVGKLRPIFHEANC